MIFTLIIVPLVLMIPLAVGLAIYIASPDWFRQNRALIISAIIGGAIVFLLVFIFFGLSPMIL